MKARLTTQTALLTAGRASGQILNAILAIVVVRHLSKAEYGTFRQIYLMAATYLQTEFGFTESLYFFLPKFPQLRAAFVRQTVFTVGAVQVLAGIVLLTFRQDVARFFNNPQLSDCLDLLVLYSGLLVITRIWEVELIAERRARFAAMIPLLFEALKVALSFVAIALSAGIRPLLWAFVAASALKFLAFLFFLAREFKLFVNAGPARMALPQVRYALYLWIPGVLSGVLSIQAHQYIVGHYFDPTQYAVYAVACFQVPFVATLSVSMSEMFLVRMTEYCAEERITEIYRLWTNACRKALLLLIGIVAVLVILAQPIIIVLFTNQYRDSAPLFAIMVLIFLFNGIFQDSLFRASSAMKTYIGYNVLRASLSLVLALVGVKYWGLKGAALSIVVSLAIVNTLQLVSCAHIMRVSFSKVLPWKDVAKMSMMAVIAALFTKLLVIMIASPTIRLIAGFPLFCMTYASLAVWLGFVSKDELHLLRFRTT